MEIALQELKKITTEQQKSNRLFEKNVKNLLSQLQEEHLPSCFTTIYALNNKPKSKKI